MLDHLSIQCADVAASARFYDAVLAPLGGTRVMDFGARALVRFLRSSLRRARSVELRLPSYPVAGIRA